MRRGLLFVVLISLAACAPQASEVGSDGSCPSTITISDFAFHPANCWVEAGTTLTFVNQDSAPHTATSLEEAVAAFDTGTLQEGQSATVTLTEVGDYPYFCEIHPGMRAMISVRPAGGDVGGESSGEM